MIDTYCTQTYSMKDLLQQEPPTFNEEEFGKIRDKLVHLEREMQNIKRNSEEAVIVCDQAIDLIKQCGSSVSLTKQVKKLESLNRAIISQPVYGLLDYYITEAAVEDLKDINQVTGSKEQDTLDAYVSARALYTSMIQAVKDLNGEKMIEPMLGVKQCLVDQIPVCERAIELIEKNQYDEKAKENVYNQLVESGKKLNVLDA